MTMTPEARELPLIARSLMIEARFRYGISPDLKMYTTLVRRNVLRPRKILSSI